MKFNEDQRFTKEFKKLKKKFRSLDEDLDLFKQVLKNKTPIDRHTTTLHEDESATIIKSRLFCKYLKGSTLRIVLVFYKTHQEVTFIEIYFKGDKPREDKLRVKEYSK